MSPKKKLSGAKNRKKKSERLKEDVVYEKEMQKYFAACKNSSELIELENPDIMHLPQKVTWKQCLLGGAFYSTTPGARNS